MKKYVLALVLGLVVAHFDFLFADEVIRVKEVVFTGSDQAELKGVSRAFLSKQVATKVGDIFDAKKANRDVKRLYAREMFETVAVRDETLPDGGKRVVFELEVAPKINYIVFQNLNLVTRKKIVSEIHEFGLEDFPEDRHDYYGRHLTHGQKIKIKEAVLHALKQKDLVDATIEMSVVDNASDVALIITVNEGRTVRVENFEVSSNANFTQSFIESRTRLATSEKWWIFGGKFSYSDLQDDIHQIKGFYRDYGYLDVTIDAVISRETVSTYWGLGDDEEEVSIDLKIEEGDLYSYGRIGVQGNKLFSKKEILETFGLKTGDVFDQKDIIDAEERLEELYGNRGYIVQRFGISEVLTNIRLDIIPDFRTKTVSLTVNIEEGREITIKDLIIRGNERTRDEVMRREMLGLLPNQPFKWSAQKEAIRRLKNLNYFEDRTGINIRLDDNVDATERDMILEVDEKKTGNFNFGVGVSSEGDVFGNFTIGQRNFDITDVSGFPVNAFDFFTNRQYVGKGQIFNLKASPGSRVTTYSIGLYEPWLFGYPVGFDVNSSFSQTEYETYSEERFSNSLSLSRRYYLADQEVLTVGMGYRDVKLALIDVEHDAPSFVTQSDFNIVLRGPSIFAKYDTRDNFQFTTEGQLHEIKYEVLGGPFGGTDLIKATQKSSIYLTVGKDRQDRKQVLSLRSRLDWSKPYDRTNTVPIFERYFLGGGSTLRGYKRYAIGPQPNGTPIGGAVRHFGGLEYSVPLYGYNLRGVSFLDYGTLHSETTGNIWNGYRFGAGVGIRFTVPGLGFPVALDLAHPVGPKSHDERKRNFHFQFAAQSQF